MWGQLATCVLCLYATAQSESVLPDQEGEWVKLPLYLTDQYSTLKDSYNMVRPEHTLTTDTFRIAMTPKPDATVGILSIDVVTE